MRRRYNTKLWAKDIQIIIPLKRDDEKQDKPLSTFQLEVDALRLAFEQL